MFIGEMEQHEHSSQVIQEKKKTSVRKLKQPKHGWNVESKKRVVQSKAGGVSQGPMWQGCPGRATQEHCHGAGEGPRPM